MFVRVCERERVRRGKLALVAPAMVRVRVCVCVLGISACNQPEGAAPRVRHEMCPARSATSKPLNLALVQTLLECVCVRVRVCVRACECILVCVCVFERMGIYL